LNTKPDDLFDISDLDPDLVLIKPVPKKPEPKKRIRNIEWGGALIGLAGGVAGIVAGRLGQIWPAFDVFSQFTIQFFFLTGAFVIATFMPRRKAFYGLLFTVVACLGYGLWAQSRSGEITRGPWDLNPGERAVRVAQFNLFHANTDLPALEKEIARIDADIITLVEFNWEKQPLLATLRAQYPYQYDCNSIDFCHFAILSRHPFAQADGKGAWAGPPYAMVRMAGNLSGLLVFAVHTTRFPHSRAQFRQIGVFVKHLESESGKLIIMGDFNATPFSRITATLEQGVNVVRHTNLPTWPTLAELPQLAIDHVFASKGIRVLADEQIGNASGSDHYPVILTLGVDN
jgi:endonuclease/exonuclease/phosphatase (EEP) superfamily protein YafD